MRRSFLLQNIFFIIIIFAYNTNNDNNTLVSPN